MKANRPTPHKTDSEKTFFTEERRIKILDMIRKNRKVMVSDLTREFSVSAATIRTDLRQLQQAGHVIRTHGGALERTKTGEELDSQQKEIQNLSEKRAIAEAALNYIEDGDTVIIDTGTTTLELAKLLHKKKNLSVVTNDIQIASVLEGCDSINIILMGGIVRKGFHCTVGIHGREITTKMIVDKAFMGTNSFSASSGATTPDLHQAETKKHMISISSKVILLCDSSKIGRASFAQFATADQIDILITNPFENSLKSQLEELGIEVVISSRR